MDGIRNYITELAAVTLMVAVINAVAPKNNAAKVCTMLGSILLIMVLISPVRRIDTSEIARMEKHYNSEINLGISRMREKYEGIEENIIEERLSAYVLSRANVQKEDCSIKFEFSENTPISAEITVGDADVFERISYVLETEIGIPRERHKKAEDK